MIHWPFKDCLVSSCPDITSQKRDMAKQQGTGGEAQQQGGGGDLLHSRAQWGFWLDNRRGLHLNFNFSNLNDFIKLYSYQRQFSDLDLYKDSIK